MRRGGERGRHEDRGGEEHVQNTAHRRPQPCQGAGAGRERHRQAGGGRAGGAGEREGGEIWGGGGKAPILAPPEVRGGRAAAPGFCGPVALGFWLRAPPCSPKWLRSFCALSLRMKVPEAAKSRQQAEMRCRWGLGLPFQPCIRPAGSASANCRPEGPNRASCFIFIP